MHGNTEPNVHIKLRPIVFEYALKFSNTHNDICIAIYIHIQHYSYTVDIAGKFGKFGESCVIH